MSYKNYPNYINCGFGILDWGFLYGIVPDPVIQGNYCGVWEYFSEYGNYPGLDVNGVFTFTFHKLAPGTTYYVTAFVFIDDFYYGNEVSFTTDK